MRKKICLLLMIVLTMICVPTFAKTKVDNGFLADEEVSLEKDINTTTFVAGNTIEMSSNVDGLNFVAGNNIALSSSQDHLFVAGNSIVLEGVMTKDAFIAGNTVTVNASSIRDLYAAASVVRIDSDISRNVYAGGEIVTINSTIEGNVKLAAEDIRIGKDAVIKGTLLYPENANISISESAQVNKTKTYVNTSSVTVEVNTIDLITTFIVSFLGLLLIAFILLTVHKRLFKSFKKEEQSGSNLAKLAGIGFAFLVVVPFACIFALITIIGIPLSIIVLILYAILIYLSSIPTAYFIGNWIMKDKKVNEYLLLGCSLLALALLKIVPIIGGLVGFASLIIGLGLFTSYIFKSIKEEKE